MSRVRVVLGTSLPRPLPRNTRVLRLSEESVRENQKCVGWNPVASFFVVARLLAASIPLTNGDWTNVSTDGFPVQIVGWEHCLSTPGLPVKQ